MPRSVRSVVSVTALLAAACGAFGTNQDEAAPAPPPSTADAATPAPAEVDGGAPLGGEDAGPPSSTCASQPCAPSAECTSADFATNAVPDGWSLKPKDNPPFVTAGHFLRSTGKQGAVSFASFGDVASSATMSITLELDFRVVQLKPGMPLGFVAFVPSADTGDAAYLAANPNGRITLCTRLGAGQPSCTGDLGGWTADTWHHLTWAIGLTTTQGQAVKASVTVDCGNAVPIAGAALPVPAFTSKLSFQVGAPVYPSLDPYAVDVDNVVRTITRGP